MPLKLKQRTAQKPAHDFRSEFAHLTSQLQIDRNCLDDDMLKQPVLYQEVSEAHVMAIAERDAAKQEVNIVAARLAHKVRTNAIKAGEKPMAEARVGDMVQMEPAYQEAFAAQSRLEARAGYLGALKGSFEQRGKMLRELGGLFIAGYFSKTTVSGPRQAVREATAAAGREGMRQARMRVSE